MFVNNKISFLSALIFFITPIALAAPKDVIPCFGNSCGIDEITNLPNSDLHTEFLPIVAKIMIYGIGIVSFVVFVVAGAILVLGWGEDDNVKKAKHSIIWGVTGLGFVMVAYVLVKGVLGLDFL
jgi:hypothetical protein